MSEANFLELQLTRDFFESWNLGAYFNCETYYGNNICVEA